MYLQGAVAPLRFSLEGKRNWPLFGLGEEFPREWIRVVAKRGAESACVSLQTTFMLKILIGRFQSTRALDKDSDAVCLFWCVGSSEN